MKIKPHPAVKVAFFHIMAEGPSGAANNIFRLFHHIDSQKLETILVGQIENELTARVKELGKQVVIIPFPPALNVYDKKLLNFNMVHLFRTLVAIWKYNILLVKLFSAHFPALNGFIKSMFENPLKIFFPEKKFIKFLLKDNKW